MTEITRSDRDRIRAQFPALGGDTVFLENAGGSQVPAAVADRVRDYMLSSYVQVGAGYELSQRATGVVDAAHDLVRMMMNGRGGEVILGPSTSELLRMLAESYVDVFEPGQEIIVAETGHEANIGPWKYLQERAGVTLKWWRMDPETCVCPLEELQNLLTDRTALVAFPHVSNLLGEIVDVVAITEMAHNAGARVVVDGVAFAPHRAIDVEAWGVDWYAFSTYKVYGPHMAGLWGTSDALEGLRGPNHFFIPPEDIPYSFELGSVCHESCAGLLGIGDYIKELAGITPADDLERADVETAFDIMTACELPLQERLVEYLLSRDDVRIVGPAHSGPSRVPTVSFVHESKSAREITEVIDRSGIAIRHGHMYAYHLCEALGLDPEDGVVRISLVHYNTPAEVERLICVLEEALG